MLFTTPLYPLKYDPHRQSMTGPVPVPGTHLNGDDIGWDDPLNSYDPNIPSDSSFNVKSYESDSIFGSLIGFCQRAVSLLVRYLTIEPRHSYQTNTGAEK
jgi:hypothetical protein